MAREGLWQEVALEEMARSSLKDEGKAGCMVADSCVSKLTAPPLAFSANGVL